MVNSLPDSPRKHVPKAWKIIVVGAAIVALPVALFITGQPGPGDLKYDVQHSLQALDYTHLPSYTESKVYTKDYAGNLMSPGDYYQIEAYYSDKSVLNTAAKRLKAAGWKCGHDAPESRDLTCEKGDQPAVSISDFEGNYVVISAEGQDS